MGFIATHYEDGCNAIKRKRLTVNAIRKLLKTREFAAGKSVARKNGLNFELRLNIYASAVRAFV